MAITMESKIQFRKTTEASGYSSYLVLADGVGIGTVAKLGGSWSESHDWLIAYKTRGAAAEQLLKLAVEAAKPAEEDDESAEPKHMITVYVSQYAPAEEGDDELTKVFEDSEEFLISDYADDMGDWADRACTQWVVADDVTVAVRLLDGYRGRFCASEASASPTDGVGVWYSDNGYDHPYTGARSEQTAHLKGFTEDEQRAIYAGLVSRKALR